MEVYEIVLRSSYKNVSDRVHCNLQSNLQFQNVASETSVEESIINRHATFPECSRFSE